MGTGEVHSGNYSGHREHDGGVHDQCYPVLGGPDIEGEVGRNEEEVIDHKAGDDTDNAREVTAAGNPDDNGNREHQRRGRRAEVHTQGQHGSGQYGYAGQRRQRSHDVAAGRLARVRVLSQGGCNRPPSSILPFGAYSWRMGSAVTAS